MRISDWSSDVCSSDLRAVHAAQTRADAARGERCFEQRRIHIDAANAATGCDIQEQVAGSLVIQSQSPGGIVALGLHDARAVRSAERRVGQECVSTCRSRWSPYQYQKN